MLFSYCEKHFSHGEGAVCARLPARAERPASRLEAAEYSHRGRGFRELAKLRAASVEQATALRRLHEFKFTFRVRVERCLRRKRQGVVK